MKHFVNFIQYCLLKNEQHRGVTLKFGPGAYIFPSLKKTIKVINYERLFKITLNITFIQ